MKGIRSKNRATILFVNLGIKILYMNKLNFYIALLGLLTAVSVLDYIADDFKAAVQIIFYITSFGLMLKMMIENFEFTKESIKKRLLFLEGKIFYLITWFMIFFILSSLLLMLIEKINLNINPIIMYLLFGLTGTYFATFVKMKDFKE